MRSFDRLLVLVGLASLVIPATALAETLSLTPRFEVGDAYALTLDSVEETEAHGRGPGDRKVSEHVKLRYTAKVTVLETDASGLPVRERHDGVQMTFERPTQSGSLFQDGVSFDVVRTPEGEIQIHVGDRRATRRSERVLTQMLERQFEHSREATLIDPGRPVDVGETWELDPRQARLFLREHGIDAIELGEPPTATLTRSDPDELVVEYAIPIARLELEKMPDQARTSRSDGLFRGEIRLTDAAGSPGLEHASELEFNLSGMTPSRRPSESHPWHLARSASHHQRTLPITSDTAAAGPAPLPARIADDL